MTQKELLYFEDAINHEESIIKLVDYAINNLQDHKLQEFMKHEREKHQTLKNSLMNKLGEKAHGQ